MKKVIPGKALVYEDLIVWQKAHALILSVYETSSAFPKSELFGLTSQLRRASVAVATNIVEGWKRYSIQEKRRCFNMAHASLEEARYLLFLVSELGWCNTSTETGLADEVGRLLTAYEKALANNRN